MIIYWIEFTVILLPGLLLMLISVLPLAIGTVAALTHLRAGRKGPYCSNLWGSVAAGVVTHLLLGGSLFGDDLSSSSTAGLIFIFVPIYSAGALFIGYLIGAAFNRFSHRTSDGTLANPPIPIWLRNLLWIPVFMFAIVLFGVTRYSILNNDLSVAERASRPETLHYVYEKIVSGNADTFGVPLFLAQNQNTPSDILYKLSKSEYPQIRVFVASNPNSPESVVASLREDHVDYVRKAVQKRIRDATQP